MEYNWARSMHQVSTKDIPEYPNIQNLLFNIHLVNKKKVNKKTNTCKICCILIFSSLYNFITSSRIVSAEKALTFGLSRRNNF